MSNSSWVLNLNLVVTGSRNVQNHCISYPFGLAVGVTLLLLSLPFLPPPRLCSRSSTARLGNGRSECNYSIVNTFAASVTLAALAEVCGLGILLIFIIVINFLNIYIIIIIIIEIIIIIIIEIIITFLINITCCYYCCY